MKLLVEATETTQIVRRSAELLAIVMSFIVYRFTTKNGECDEIKRKKWEKRSNAFVGAMMCLAGVIMALLALTVTSGDKGNVVPGLVIAVLGVIANSIFWRKYTRLNRESPNAILAVQSRLYRAKALVDISVTTALLSVLIAPQSEVSYWLDMIGSLIVAGYLAGCGVKTVREAFRKYKGTACK